MLHGGQPGNPRRPPSSISRSDSCLNINGIVRLDTKIERLSGLGANLVVYFGLSMVAILEIRLGRPPSYIFRKWLLLKLKTKVRSCTWKKLMIYLPPPPKCPHFSQILSKAAERRIIQFFIFIFYNILALLSFYLNSVLFLNVQGCIIL